MPMKGIESQKYRKVRLGVCLRLHNKQAAEHLKPLLDHPSVTKLHIVRHEPIKGLASSKVQYYIINNKMKCRRFFLMYQKCKELVRNNQVDAFVSFNPIPYGCISALASRSKNIPFHFGFIGSDWYGNSQSLFWRIFKSLLKKASFITVTGKSMLNQTISMGLNPENIAVLPHSIDLERFQICDQGVKKYNFIFVGQLIKRKRVDLILQALSMIRKEYQNTKLCIVGDGPLRKALEQQVRRLALTDAVDFIGQTDSVQNYLNQAKILVMASDMEGFPFAIVEALCSGLVPVSTRTGTIDDVLIDGKSGFIVECRDVNGLANSMVRLLKDHNLYQQMQEDIFKLRKDYTYEKATDIWDQWLSKLEKTS